MKHFVVAGIGTGVGKTLVSAILTEALGADYWKPVQAGDLDRSDSITVKHLVSNPATRFLPECYRLNSPMSPHAAAAIDGISIDPSKFVLPDTTNICLIELAGGLMVPLTNNFLNIDLLQTWMVPVVLVSQNYLGSINHTLLSVELLKARHIPLKGIVFNGPENKSSESLILSYAQTTCLGRIPQLEHIDRHLVTSLAQEFKTFAL